MCFLFNRTTHQVFVTYLTGALYVHRLWFYRVIRIDCRGFNNLSYTKHFRKECMYFLFNRTTLQVFVTYLTDALYVHPLWFYKHQHDNPVRSKLFVACQRWWFQWPLWFVPSVSWIHTHPVSWNCACHLRMELSDGGCFPNSVRNCRWTIVPRQSFWITLYFNNAAHLCFLLILDIRRNILGSNLRMITRERMWYWWQW